MDNTARSDQFAEPKRKFDPKDLGSIIKRRQELGLEPEPTIGNWYKKQNQQYRHDAGGYPEETIKIDTNNPKDMEIVNVDDHQMAKLLEDHKQTFRGFMVQKEMIDFRRVATSYRREESDQIIIQKKQKKDEQRKA